MAQGGNVFEWNETAYDGINNEAGESRDLRGGSWDYISNGLNASSRDSGNPTNGEYFLGFRVASVPEPSALSLLAIGLSGLALVRRRKQS
jgi:formylglycine-generating enzyme required for sulfatase activity